MKTLQKTHCYK